MGAASEALAQTAPDVIEQTLDRADVFSRTKAQGVSPTPLTYAVTATTAFTECQNTSTRGMFCLDDNVVRNWPDPEKAPEASSTLFACSDPAFALDTRCDLHGDDGRPVGQRLARRQEEQRVQPVQGGQGALHGGLYGADKRGGLLCPGVRVRPPAAGRYLAGGR